MKDDIAADKGNVDYFHHIYDDDWIPGTMLFYRYYL